MQSPMRIAVPTMDGTSVSEHFGRSQAFLIFEVEDGQIKHRELRKNPSLHSHEQGACHAAAGHHEPHSHDSIVSSLSGCAVVLCHGMGRAMAGALQSSGIVAVNVQGQTVAEGAVTSYLRGDLRAGSLDLCHCES